MGEIRLVELDAEQGRRNFSKLIDTYLDVYADSSDEFFSKERYTEQLDSHLEAPGWTAICAYDAEELIGYIYGFPLSPRTGWWEGLMEAAPPGFTQETEGRTFAISEILVKKSYQRRGIATWLHKRLIEGRTEERATLLVEPENAAAQAAYGSWGWTKVNRLHPDWGDIQAPVYDVMMLELSGKS